MAMAKPVALSVIDTVMYNGMRHATHTVTAVVLEAPCFGTRMDSPIYKHYEYVHGNVSAGNSSYHSYTNTSGLINVSTTMCKY